MSNNNDNNNNERVYTHTEMENIVRSIIEQMEDERETERISETPIPLEIIEELEENTRFQARVAMEIFEELQQLLQQNPEQQQARRVLENIIEHSKRLTTFGLATAKAQEREARTYANKALNFPISIKHLETNEEDSKTKNAYSEEFLTHFHQARFEQRILQQQSHGYRGCEMEISNEEEVVGIEDEDHEQHKQLSQPQYSTPQQQPVQQQHTTTIIDHKGTNSHYIIPADGIAPGGRIQKFYHNWKKITIHQWPLSVVQEGFKIHFHQQPTPWKLKQIHVKPEDQYAVDEAVKKILDAQIIKISPTQYTGFLSNFFTIQETNKRRPILDCKMINRFIQCHHFKMEGVPALRDILEEKDYICKLDLKDAYVVTPIHQESRKFLTFLHKNKVYQYKTLAFGMSIGILSGRYLHFGEDKNRSLYTYNDSDNTLRKPGFCDKQGKEHNNTFTTTRFSWVYVQFVKDDDIGSKQKTIKTKIKSETSSEYVQRSLMSVDGQLVRENDFSNTSNRRSPSTHMVSTTGSREEFTLPSSAMGSSLQVITSEPTRITLVDGVEPAKKWLTNKKKINKTKYSNLCGRFKFRMRSNVKLCKDSKVMDSTGTTTIYQRTRIKNNSIRTTTSHPKISRESHKNLYRQYHRTKIRNEIGRHFVIYPSRDSSQYTGALRSVSAQCGVSTHPGYSKHSSRRTQSHLPTKTTNITTLVRSKVNQEDFQANTTTMGSQDDRCIRQPNKYTTQNILEPACRSRSSTPRCLSTNLDKERHVLISTMEIHPSSYSQNQTTKDSRSSAHNTILDNTVLVPDDNLNETIEYTKHIQTKEVDYDRMATIKRKKTERKWVDWCNQQRPKINPEEYEPKNVFKYLMENRNYSSQYLNGLRSSIASVFKLIHPNNTLIAEVDCIQEFFEAKRKSEFIIPTKEKFQTWDLDVLKNYIKKKWPAADHNTMSLYYLQIKTILVMCMTTFGRPRSDVGRILYQDVHLEYEMNQVTSVLLHFREAKETQVKSQIFGILKDEDLCLVRILHSFMDRTKHLRSSLPDNHTLFLKFIFDPNKVGSVSPGTVATWIKTSSSTKAVENGITIPNVKNHGNWSQQAFTFEKYYLKPHTAKATSTEIANSFFLPSENSTTFGEDLQSMRIVEENSTNNMNVDEEDSKNVVTTRPWYQRWWP
ncbi:hypothetical protein INT45_012487 [Circinella minor]|uniref:Reverse transcriptase domain-containing protein n=1 Tax=Circinella minor TaxID=1195481 RepID=A0A8H7VH82_9FUNG|nr:hypothetical protein INT45_012487 [Circinella minor]